MLEKSNLNLPVFIKGKVRDVYDLGDKLLIITSDRISAFDYVLPTPIPDKGKILNKLSLFWFNYLKFVVPNHIIESDVEKFPVELQKYKEILRDRSVIVKKTRKINIECVVRGYLAGSAWKEYQSNRTVCGIKLPENLHESDKLSDPIFTPATKEEKGKHDINISKSELKQIIGSKLADKLEKLSLDIYKKSSEYAEKRGIIIADTKFEFGILDGDVILIDELLTPDSSRFWDKTKYEPGKSQDSFDKQFVRDYLESIKWNKEPPVPLLPPDIVEKTRIRYQEALSRLTGKEI